MLYSKIFGVLIAACAISAVATPAQASLINGVPTGRAYSLRQFFHITNEVDSAKVIYNGGTNSLQPGPANANIKGYNFVWKNLWMSVERLNESPCYLEAGILHNNSSAIAQQEDPTDPFRAPPSLKAYAISQNVWSTTKNQWVQIHNIYGGNPGAAAATGGTVEIKRINANGSYQVVINGATALTMSPLCRTKAGTLYTPNLANNIDVGIEANDTTGTFTSGTTTDLKIRLVNAAGVVGPYVNESAQIGAEGSSYYPTWKTAYDQATGRIKMTR
jgi:hypothetical protein